MLEPLGVDEATFAVYHALLSHPDSTPEQISARLNSPLDEVLQIMEHLRKLELLVPTWTDPDSEHAVHPRVGPRRSQALGGLTGAEPQSKQDRRLGLATGESSDQLE